MENLGTVILAVGALGTAAMGIVEALKWTPLGFVGFGGLMQLLGALKEALAVAYGSDYVRLVRAQYRGDEQDLARVLRQGVRVGLTESNATSLGRFLGSIDTETLQKAVRIAETGGELTAEERNVIGRFELAADLRIDAGLSLARHRYTSATRVTASIVAVGIAIAVAQFLEVRTIHAIIVGLAAVPVAPIAKDVVTAIQSAATALRKKS